MIGYLQGQVLDSKDATILVGVGDPERGGVVGYLLSVPSSAPYGVHLRGSRIQLYVHTHVREDALDLYGFLNLSEKDVFETLIGVSGIGPKVALGILSASDPNALVVAIVTGDRDYLVSLPGVGKKTAERVILELQDRLKKHSVSHPATTPPVSATVDDSLFEARSALLGLGYRDIQIQMAVERIRASGTNPASAEAWVRLCLKVMMEGVSGEFSAGT